MKKSTTRVRSANLWVYFIPMIVGFFVFGLVALSAVFGTGGSGSDMGVGFFASIIVVVPVIFFVYAAYLALSAIIIFLTRRQRILQWVVSFVFAGLSLFAPLAFQSITNNLQEEDKMVLQENKESVRLSKETGTITRCNEVLDQNWRECIASGFVQLSQYDECMAQQASRQGRTGKICEDVQFRLREYPQWTSINDCAPTILPEASRDGIRAQWEEWKWCLDKMLNTEEEKATCVEQSTVWGALGYYYPWSQCTICLSSNQSGKSEIASIPCL